MGAEDSSRWQALSRPRLQFCVDGLGSAKPPFHFLSPHFPHHRDSLIGGSRGSMFASGCLQPLRHPSGRSLRCCVRWREFRTCLEPPYCRFAILHQCRIRVCTAVGDVAYMYSQKMDGNHLRVGRIRNGRAGLLLRSTATESNDNVLGWTNCWTSGSSMLGGVPDASCSQPRPTDGNRWSSRRAASLRRLVLMQPDQVLWL